jgi:putative glutamine amidotransferase
VATPTVGVIMSYAEERLFLERYGRVLEAAGALPVYLPYPAGEAALDGYLRWCDGFVATGGEDIDPAEYGERPLPELGPVDRARDAFELALLRRAVARDRPVLGICRGVQALNVAVGGRLYQDLRAQRPGTLVHEPVPLWDADGRLAACSHEVAVEPDSRLAAALGRTHLAVNSYHHQAVSHPGRDVRVVARAPDGVVEAIELPRHRFAVGVQWHLELMVGQDGGAEALLGRFLEACGRSAGGVRARATGSGGARA